MKHLILFLLFVSISISQIKLPENQLEPFTPEDLLSMNRLADPQVSPDGKYVLFSQTECDIRTNKKNSDLWIYDFETENTKKITNRPTSEYQARWIENGNKIAFLSSQMGSPQIFTLEIENGKAKGKPKGLTAIVGGVGTFRYSPDGTMIAYTSDIKFRKDLKDKYPELGGINVLSYDDLPVRHWDHWEDNKASHIFLIPSSGSGQPVDIMKGEPFECPLQPFGGVENYCWSPNSKEIAYTSKKVDDYEKSTNSDIYVYNLESKSTKNITKDNPGYDKNPKYSPDGSKIAFLRQKRAGFEADKVRLMIYDNALATSKDVTVNIDQWVSQFAWSKSSEQLYFSATGKGIEPLYSVNLSDLKINELAGGRYNYSSGIDVLPDGNTIVVGRTSMTEPTDLFAVPSTGGKPDRLTVANAVIMPRIKNIKIEEKIIKASDGKDIHTWVLYPPDFDSTKKYPMITYCQGGPQGTISNYFSYRWNLYLMASQGYVVCAPNRRGMPGFGQEWNDEISKDWGGQAMDDILSATDALAAESFVNNSKLACVGPSFGGYSVFWLAGHHEGRFKTFISHCGVFNLTSMYGATEELFFPNWEFGGPYWIDDNEDQFKDFSPHNYVDKWDTPMLVITGVKDFRVPYTQSLEAFTALQAQGIESKLMVFPEENHWVLSLQNALVWQNEFFDWLDKYCK